MLVGLGTCARSRPGRRRLGNGAEVSPLVTSLNVNEDWFAYGVFIRLRCPLTMFDCFGAAVARAGVADLLSGPLCDGDPREAATRPKVLFVLNGTDQALYDGRSLPFGLFLDGNFFCTRVESRLCFGRGIPPLWSMDRSLPFA